MGLPIGRRQTDWARVAKLGAAGLGAVSTAAGGVGAKRAGGRIKSAVTDQVQAGRQTFDKVGKVAERASSLIPGGGGKDGNGDGSDSGTNVKKLRLIIKESIDVGVPLETAYNQWTQFAELPQIMKGPQEVDQEEDDETRWVVKIGPSRRRWTASIVEQIPDERIVWESTEGAEHRGAVTFHELDQNLTRVQVEMEYFPHGFMEKVGNIFLVARRRARKDLRLFKHFIELAGHETGAWRGEILGDEHDEDEDEAAEPESPESDNGSRKRAGRARATKSRRRGGEESQGNEEGARASRS
jgi:uncharacterized membrane protein